MVLRTFPFQNVHVCYLNLKAWLNSSFQSKYAIFPTYKQT